MLPPVVDVVPPYAVPADVRWYADGRSPRAACDAGHLPGAVFIDLAEDLAGPAAPHGGRHPLPDPAQFAAAMSTVGIGDRDPVVAYDDEGGVMAARLVWMLRVIGHDAALLDGGLAAYRGPLERLTPARPRATFRSRPWPVERLAGPDDALDPANVVLDARAGERFRGEVEPLDARAGHVPGALSLPCRDNLGPDGRLLPVQELRRRFAAVGADSGDVVSYCGSGVTACHTLLALEHAGLGTGRRFPGSWSAYSADPDRPVALGR